MWKNIHKSWNFSLKRELFHQNIMAGIRFFFCWFLLILLIFIKQQICWRKPCFSYKSYWISFINKNIIISHTKFFKNFILWRVSVSIWTFWHIWVCRQKISVSSVCREQKSLMITALMLFHSISYVFDTQLRLSPVSVDGFWWKVAVWKRYK